MYKDWCFRNSVGQTFSLFAFGLKRKKVFMSSSAHSSITIVEVLELIRPYDEFVAVIEAAVRRLEVEGIAELVRGLFYDVTMGSMVQLHR